jgi:hypothetical protein
MLPISIHLNFCGLGRKQGPGARNPLANAATSLAMTENKQWASPRDYSIVFICNSYQRATSCSLSAVSYHFTSRLTLDFRHNHLSRAINVS